MSIETTFEECMQQWRQRKSLKNSTALLNTMETQVNKMMECLYMRFSPIDKWVDPAYIPTNQEELELMERFQPLINSTRGYNLKQQILDQLNQHR